MIEITESFLLSISPGANKSIVTALAEQLQKYLPEYGITTPLRLSHFLGQGAEETAGFRTLREYASGNEYEGRTDLGNTQAGDGPRFKGRGIFQLTGRSNYTSMGAKLGVDLVNNPELAETPEIAVRTACEYWKGRNLQNYADADDIMGITKRINGGYNGIDDRKIYTARAKKAVLQASVLAQNPMLAGNDPQVENKPTNGANETDIQPVVVQPIPDVVPAKQPDIQPVVVPESSANVVIATSNTNSAVSSANSANAVPTGFFTKYEADLTNLITSFEKAL